MREKLLFACMSFGLSLSAVHPVAAQAANLPSLAGSWQLTLTPVSPTASVPVRVAALATFTSDGSVIETDATQVVPMMVEGTAVYGTPGHGIWQPGPAIGNLFIQFISLLLNQNETLHAKKIARPHCFWPKCRNWDNSIAEKSRPWSESPPSIVTAASCAANAPSSADAAASVTASTWLL